MPDSYPHLRLIREQPVNQRRQRRPPLPPGEPRDPKDFGARLRARLQRAEELAAENLGGFDDRRLIKLELNTPLDPDQIRHIAEEIEIVSQEDKRIILAFASASALEAFEGKLAALAEGGRPTYRNVLYALEDVGAWSDEDRTGWALGHEGWPVQWPTLLDVELWPAFTAADDERCWRGFEDWLGKQKIEKRDAVKRPGLLLYRLRVDAEQARLLLRHRDVRTVDLPPRHGLDVRLLQTEAQNLPAVAAPGEGAPGICVLDSGIAGGHPMLGPAVGDAQSFLADLGSEDEHGHGTLIGGLALYGDVEAALRDRRLTPALRLFSGRVLDAENLNESGFVENHVEQAVRYFHREYNCRVFNLSYGDSRKPYTGRHVRGLAVTLDTLARELSVLFVIPTGNFTGTQDIPADWRADYPRYLLHPEAALIDPAPALNALTVGSLARWDATFNSQRYTNDPAERPIALRDQPSPFTRSGPSVGNAIKPELVAYGGNWAVQTRDTSQWRLPQGLGEISTCKDFATGRVLAEECGSSFSAPQVAHLAARILAEHPEADHNLLRALLVAHARWPERVETLLSEREDRLRICGYGKVDETALERSTEREVTLTAADGIPDRCHHFYEIPLPQEFMEGPHRTRELVVALAHSPAVRTTRLSYKSCDMEFRFVWSDDLATITRMFNAATSRDDYQRIPEATGPRIGARNRGAGTVQVDAWTLRRVTGQRRMQRAFVVVTRIDEMWGRSVTLTEEPYAMVVVMQDRGNAEARLYSQIQARLRARIQTRLRT